MNYLKRALTWLAPALLVAAMFGVWSLVASILYALHMAHGRLSGGTALVGFGMEFVLVGLFSLVLAGIEAPSKRGWFRDHLRHGCGLYGATLLALLLISGAGHVSDALTFMVSLGLGAVAGNAFALYLTHEYLRLAA